MSEGLFLLVIVFDKCCITILLKKAVVETVSKKNK